jgi:hypothetical protein
MLSKFFGKSNKAPETPKDAVDSRGLEVIENDPETAWDLWDSALAEQDSRFFVNGPDPTTLSAPLTPRGSAISELPTVPQDLQGRSLEQRKNDALDMVELHHRRIANTIRTLWGYKECSAYINKLIMSGGDGMGQNRVGFHQEAVEAMLALGELHDAEFGAVDTSSMRLV